MCEKGEGRRAWPLILFRQGILVLDVDPAVQQLDTTNDGLVVRLILVEAETSRNPSEEGWSCRHKPRPSERGFVNDKRLQGSRELIRISYHRTDGFLRPARRGTETSLTKGLETDLSAHPNLVEEFRCRRWQPRWATCSDVHLSM